MVTTPTEEELQQLARTVEMFEAITISQPGDYQSLEILKEAYVKLGRHDDVCRITKKLAAAYAQGGQISQAILEYEGILQRFPNDQDVLNALAELESRTRSFSHSTEESGVPSNDADSKPTSSAPAVTAGAAAPRLAESETGDQTFAEILITEKLQTPQALEPLLRQLQAQRPEAVRKGQAVTLAQILAEQQLMKLDDLLLFMVNKTGLPYLPLGAYDVDRDVACLIPRDVGFQHCTIAFDVVGRAALVATANPFDKVARDTVKRLLNYNLFWYIAAPGEIVTALRKVHGMEGRGSRSGSGS